MTEQQAAMVDLAVEARAVSLLGPVPWPEPLILAAVAVAVLVVTVRSVPLAVAV
jgi:hypothetical protein